jgi:hypothetical protein
MAEQVSGPGQLSQRTDLNTSAQPVRYISDGTYGEGKELMGLQQGATMAGQTPQPSMNPVQAVRQAKPITPLTAITQRPNEPRTAGVDYGAGVGSDALTLPPLQPQQKTLKSIVEELIPFDETGEISAIYNFLSDRGN